MSEQDQVETCMKLQQLLNFCYAGSTGMDEGIPTGLQLPDGEILTSNFGICLVNTATLRRIHKLNEEPEAHLYLVSEEVEQQVDRNCLCLCVGIQRGEGSMEYVALHECRLLTN